MPLGQMLLKSEVPQKPLVFSTLVLPMKVAV